MICSFLTCAILISIVEPNLYLCTSPNRRTNSWKKSPFFWPSGNRSYIISMAANWFTSQKSYKCRPIRCFTIEMITNACNTVWNRILSSISFVGIYIFFFWNQEFFHFGILFSVTSNISFSELQFNTNWYW